MPKIDPKPWRDHAARLALMGLHVVPVAPRTKQPLITGWMDAATRDLDQIRRWASEHPDANVGVVLREHLVVDVDDAEEFAMWLGDRALPRTMTVLTGRGRHRYYTLPGLAEGLRTTKVPGADLKVSGLVVGPGSVHPSGATYRLATPQAMCEAPDWLIEQVVPAPPSPPEQGRDGEWTVQRQLRVASTVLAARVGRRNDLAFWGFCKAFESGAPEFVDRVRGAALGTGLDPDEVARCEASAAERVARDSVGAA
ncbi:bifunctional DNA primase/polymerase [Dietzia natronolimnaea]|uniref:bifunctional DNA primase/polymerase n=1 Tax=Dietzia natronolimnaea TaxID=161920 RepID=UPI0015FDB3A8|nr:bifunctional DNA primase/polymerase [Dietzia natronolimnaea]MBB1036723.1 bifunctional DNA primase/polymerase [Dietzia natronolimnaea]